MNTPVHLKSGNQAFSRGDYRGALHHYRLALKGIRGDPTLLADVYGNLANLFAATSDVDQAVSYYTRAIEILRREENYGRLGTTFANIGNLYLDHGDLAKAMEHYQKAHLLLERAEQWDELSTLYGNLSLMSLRQSNPQEGYAYANKAYDCAKKIARPGLLAQSLHRRAKAKEAMGEREGALSDSLAASAHFIKQQDELGYAMTVYHQASLHEKQGSLGEAIDCLTRVVAIDEKYGLPKLAQNRARLNDLRAKLKIHRCDSDRSNRA